MAEVAVLTTTFYKSTTELRFRLAVSLVEKARQAGHDVVIVDGSPEPAVQKEFRGLGAHVLTQKTLGIGPSRRELFGHASVPWTYGLPSIANIPPFLVWTEPEKDDLIRHIPAIVEPLKTGKAQRIVLAKRKSLEGYPAFQAQTETEGDQVYMEVTSLSGGPMFGPIAFVAEMLPYFTKCNPKERYGPEAHDTYIQHIAPMEAIADGHHVSVVEIDFIYPLEQKAEEESALSEEMKKKRLWQLDECTRTYRIVAKALGLPKK